VGNAGNLKVDLTSNQAGFVAGMQESHFALVKFLGLAEQSGTHLSKFDLHTLASKRVMGSLQAATGMATSGLAHMIHGFTLAPGPIGAAIAAFIAFREVVEFTKTTQEESKKKMEEHVDIMKHAKEMLSTHQESPFQKMDDEIQSLNDHASELQRQMTRIAWIKTELLMEGKIGLFSSRDEINREVKAVQDMKRAMMEGAYKTRDKLMEERAAGYTGKKDREQHGGVLQGVEAGQIGMFKLEHSVSDDLLQKIESNTAQLVQNGFPKQERG
jgi:hypothetical protein